MQHGSLSGTLRSLVRSATARRRIRRLRPHPTAVELIRIGAEHDGGYLVPDDLEGIVACFSPGVADMCDFELDIAARGIPVFMADASVAGPPKPHPLFRFDPLFLGASTGGTTISLDDWVARNAPPSGDLLLQMDIEGAEYDVLTAVSTETLCRFRIIALEVHRLDRLFSIRGGRGAVEMFDRLLNHFEIVHAHPNNHAAPSEESGLRISRTMEFTFLRRDRVRRGDRPVRLPHPLDAPNLPDRPDHPLPDVWRR